MTTDTTFFIDTKAAFEHAFEAGAFAEADADDFMYMHSDINTPGAVWIDYFKHRDTRKYLRVRRTQRIEPDTVQAVARGEPATVHAGTKPADRANVNGRHPSALVERAGAKPPFEIKDPDAKAFTRHFADKPVGKPAGLVIETIPDPLPSTRNRLHDFHIDSFGMGAAPVTVRAFGICSALRAWFKTLGKDSTLMVPDSTVTITIHRRPE